MARKLKIPKDSGRLLEMASSAALQAGRWLRRRTEASRQVKKRARHDIKIAADREADRLIIDQLRSASEYAIVSEEAGCIGAVDQNQAQLVWIIDPLDGTLNYHQGIPFCCVSIGLYRGWTPVLGVIYDFMRGEFFSGVVGEGARCNGSVIRPSEVNRPSTAVIGTGFPVNRDFSTASLRWFIETIQHYRKVRLLGSAALSLAYVACGRLDAYAEENIMFWDVAAGCALLEAAGGKQYVERTSDSFTHPVVVTAGNGKFSLEH